MRSSSHLYQISIPMSQVTCGPVLPYRLRSSLVFQLAEEQLDSFFSQQLTLPTSSKQSQLQLASRGHHSAMPSYPVIMLHPQHRPSLFYY